MSSSVKSVPNTERSHKQKKHNTGAATHRAATHKTPQSHTFFSQSLPKAIRERLDRDSKPEQWALPARNNYYQYETPRKDHVVENVTHRIKSSDKLVPIPSAKTPREADTTHLSMFERTELSVLSPRNHPSHTKFYTWEPAKHQAPQKSKIYLGYKKKVQKAERDLCLLTLPGKAYAASLRESARVAGVFGVKEMAAEAETRDQTMTGHYFLKTTFKKNTATRTTTAPQKKKNKRQQLEPQQHLHQTNNNRGWKVEEITHEAVGPYVPREKRVDQRGRRRKKNQVLLLLCHILLFFPAVPV